MVKIADLTNDPNLVYLAYRGSHSHGLYISPENECGTDDIDLMGIVIPTVDHYFGLKEFSHRGTKEFWINEYDIVYYEILKFVRLLCGGNPNVMGMLWLEPQFILKCHPVFETLIKNRDLFVTKTIYNSYIGYAHSQVKRMTNFHHAGYMGDKRKSLVDKFGYDVKNASHCIRLLRMGIEALQTGKINVMRTHDRQQLLDIKTGKYTLEEVKDMADSLFQSIGSAHETSELPKDVDEQKVNELVTKMLLNYFSV